VYFCRVLDNPFDDIFAEDDGTNVHKDPNYEAGSYLDNLEHLLITPLEPSEGNYLISATKGNNSKVILKIVSSGIAIELGCFFQSRTIVGDMPAIQLSFPQVAQKSKKAREFRAKVPKSMKVIVSIERNKKKPITTSPLNISLNGMSLIDPMGRKSNITIQEKVLCTIQSPNEDPIVIEASVKHLTNLRHVSGIQYCFGIQFHFNSVTAKSAVEKLVGLVQRKHLRELSEIEQKFGVYYEK
jgi:c-di-GMP-binding flagellar brake protein YcgR